MDVSLDVRKFLRNRRDRAVGSVLGYAEENIKPKLTQPQWESFRRVVLDATNSYHDTVLDIVKSDESVRNDHLISLLERVDRNLKRSIAEADAGQEQRKQGIVDDEAKLERLFEATP